MFIGRTPNDPIAVRKQRQRQYKEELDRQVNARYNMQQQQQITAGQEELGILICPDQSLLIPRT